MVEPHVPATCPPLEDLAAFLDARLTGADRERIVAHLASCERCYEVVAEVLHTRSEVADAESGGEVAPATPAAPGTVLPFRRRLRGLLKRSFETRFIAAVALPLAALVAVAVWRPWEVPPLDLATLTIGLGRAEQAAVLAPAIGDHIEWARNRGAAPPPSREDEAAFKAGVRSVDLAVSLALEDRQLARSHAADLKRAISGIDFADSPEVQCRALFETLPEGDLGALRRDLAEIDEGLETVLSGKGDERPRLYLRLGKWAQATRLRALTGPPPDSSATRRTIDRFREVGLPTDIDGYLARADELLRDGLDPAESVKFAGELGDLVESGVEIP